MSLLTRFAWKTRLLSLLLAFAAAAVVAAAGAEDEGEGEYEQSFDPGNPQYQRDGCTACRSAFDYVDHCLTRPRAGQSAELLEAEILDADPCQWCVGPTQLKCYTIVEELEETGALLSYVAGSRPSDEGRLRRCAKWCTT
eukprot:Rhum_TRINITY_DN25497_c0_g1::Rhum_TRINITY_DN25497_c0_g1_i1::g.182238::m.182238